MATGDVEFANDPYSFRAPTGLPEGTSKRRKLTDVLQDPTFALGPGIEDDSAAYDRFLASGEAARRREEAGATEGVLNSLQGRGLARSGIALKDIISQVLGPSSDRASALAAQFGLEQARNRSNLLENQRNRQYGGRLNAILQDEQANAGMDSQVLQGLQGIQQGKQQGSFGVLTGSQAQEAERRRAEAEARGGRQNALIGALGGAGGAAITAFCFHPETKIVMSDGSEKKIVDVRLGDKTKGGDVLSVRYGFSSDMRDYDGVKVTGSHAVNEAGYWRRVQDSLIQTPVPGLFEVVSLITTDHRIYAGGIEFADEIEVDGGDQMTNELSLNHLNGFRSFPVTSNAAA